MNLMRGGWGLRASSEPMGYARRRPWAWASLSIVIILATVRAEASQYSIWASPPAWQEEFLAPLSNEERAPFLHPDSVICYVLVDPRDPGSATMKIDDLPVLYRVGPLSDQQIAELGRLAFNRQFEYSMGGHGCICHPDIAFQFWLGTHSEMLTVSISCRELRVHVESNYRSARYKHIEKRVHSFLANLVTDERILRQLWQ